MRDCEPVKGVYYLNGVDEVTQWESVVAVPALTRRFVQPVLRQVLEQTFPFEVFGLHADNGRVESKNASVVRKQFGYGHIPVGFYEDINGFTIGVLAEHLNFHRPCWFPKEQSDAKGRLVRQYRRISDNDSTTRLLRERKKLFEPILADLSLAA